MDISYDVADQFSSFFKSESLKPYASLVIRKLEEGSICLDVNYELENQQSLNENEKSFLVSESELAAEPQVSVDPEIKQPFILYNHKLYLQRYFHYETVILERIKTFIKNEKEFYKSRAEFLSDNKNLIKSLFPARDNTTVDWQLLAALSAVLNNFTIITGGPGTGKTTTVAKILAILFSSQSSLRVALAAPTGKAAARMAATLKANIEVDENVKELFKTLEPSTIHRLLEYKSNSTGFKHNKDNPLPFDVVIIDESSMIDITLFAKLFDAIGPDTRLILLGDKDQLASVEAGSLFGDICLAMDKLNIFSKTRTSFFNEFLSTQILPATDYQDHPLFEHLIELTFSHRFSKEEGIGKFSTAIINNDTKILKEFLKTDVSSRVKIDTNNSKDIFESFIDGYSSFIKEKDISEALKKLNEIRVLCAVRQGENGLYSLNKRIEEYLHRKKLIDKNSDFYENRPIIITSNFYRLGLFNGDIGILRKDNNGRMRAWFEDGENLKQVLPGYLTSAETVFAMTTHKSQGSEFGKVLIVLPTIESPVLTRELLYTAVTRAKKEVVIQSTEKILLRTAEVNVRRGSGLIERFLEQQVKA